MKEEIHNTHRKDYYIHMKLHTTARRNTRGPRRGIRGREVGRKGEVKRHQKEQLWIKEEEKQKGGRIHMFSS
jgi:hypothetical protein